MNKIIEKVESFLEWGGTKKDIVLLVISGISLLMSIFNISPLPFNIAWIAIVLCGVPIVAEAIIGLITEFDIKADVLVSMALVASVCIGEIFAAGEVAFIMQIGALLEELTVTKARAGIEKLVHLMPQTARVVNGNEEKIIPAKDVKKGDFLRVLPGETIAVDGIIVSGETSVNQAVMTGEPLPVDKTVGDNVTSGTVNQFGSFEMRAEKVGKDSSIQRMIELVQSADAGKAKIVTLADKWAVWIVVIALVSAAITWFVSGEIIRAVTILVVFCPCALVLATPTAIMAAIGNVTKHGFLVKEGDALERLARVSQIAFDKTGTLTYGKPTVTDVKSFSEKYSDEEIYSVGAAIEKLSEHPLAKAVIECYKNEVNKDIVKATDFKMYQGKGVRAEVNSVMYYAGNGKLMSENNIAVDEKIKTQADKHINQGSNVIFIANEKQTIGYIVLTDTVREESAYTIKAIKNIGIEPVLLTGDNKNAAETIANSVGITTVKSECMPEDKLKYIKNCQEISKEICMIGDGINDAPALKTANVGIAMGKDGSDIAIDAADIALINDEINELPHLLSLSKRMMTTIKINLTFSMLLNFAAIILAITGVLNPVVGALVHNAGSVLVITNSALLLKWKRKNSLL